MPNNGLAVCLVPDLELQTLKIQMKKEHNLENSTEQASSIPVVSKRFIELTREDLVEFKSDLPIDDVSIHDFKSSAMSRDEMHKAELITFKDGEQIKELKNRYRVW